MSLRRFQNFQVGALTAERLNELVDAVSRLQAKVDAIPTGIEPVRERILARITATATVSDGTACTGGVPVVSYPFSQVFVTIAQDGAITAGTCVRMEIPDDAISSQRGAYLIRFEKEATLKVGDIVNAQLASIALDGSAQDKQQVYIVADGLMGGGGEMRIATLTQALTIGMYKATLNGDNQEVELNNLYETQGYYGAGAASTECATVSPGTLALGAQVWASKVGGTGDWRGKWITMTPVPFSAECTCGDLGQPLSLMSGKAGVEEQAAGIVSRIMGGL